MFARQIALTGLLLMPLVARSAWAQSSDPLLPSPQLLSRFGLERMWWGQGVLNLSRDRVRYLHVDEDSIYVQSLNGVVTAFEAETGERRWAIKLGNYDAPGFRIATNEEFAMVVTGSTLYGLDKFSGKSLWKLRLPSPPSTSPIADDEQVYVGMLDGSVYAYKLQKIYDLQREGKLPDWSYDCMSWRMMTSGEIASAPVLFDERICVANRNGDVYGVTTAHREMVFEFQSKSPIIAPISRVGELLFVATESNDFYALRVKKRAEMVNPEHTSARTTHTPLMKKDKESGKIVWEFVSGRPIRNMPMGIGPDVFLLPDRGGIYSLASETGIQKWWQPNGTEFVAATAGNVYVSDADHNLLMLSRADGSIRGNVPLRRFDFRLANNRTDRLVLATNTGLIVVLREKGRTVPTFHMFPERLPLMPEFESEEGGPSGEERSQPDAAADSEPAENQ